MTDITWTGASGDWTEADDWTPAQVPALGDNATIAGTGTISVIVSGGETAAAGSVLLDNANATLEIDGLLNTNTISLDAGTLTNDGTIADATLVLSGGTLSSGYGLYQGDTIVGTMEIGGSDTAVVQQGLTALAADGTSPGTVTVDGAYATLEFNDSETFDKATVVLGSAGGLDMLDAEGTLTLGSNAVVETAGTNFIDMITGNGTVINDGTILANASSGTFTIEPGSFVNDGTLAVSGGIEMDIEPSGTFANAGTVTVGDGSTLAIQYLTSFVNTGSIVVQGGGTLSLDTYASALSTTQTAGGSVEVDGLLLGNGETITVSADSAFATLTNDGTIADATLVLSGGTLSSGYGLYQGDTIVGTMEIGGSDTAVVQQGLTALAADGTSPGTVTVDGAYATLEFNDSETFDKATVVLGSAGGVDMLDAEGTLTLGTNAVVETAGTNFIDMITGNGTVINDGTILANASSGTFTIEPGSFVNDGTVAVSGGIEMDIEPSGTFANAGTVTVGDGSTLAIQYLTSFVNTGSIVVQGGGTLSLDTYASALSTTQSAGGSVEVDGLLNANGGTITVSADSAFATLTNNGTIADATLVLSGGTLSSGYGLYQGDTIVGTMEIGSSDTAVVQQGLTALAADGTSPGTVTVDGSYATLEFNDSETFDKATVVLGSAAGLDMLDAEGTLTLGSNAVVETAGTNFIDMITGNGTVINDGTILANASSGTFTIEPGSFVNDGTLAVSGGIEMDIEPSGTFANAGTVTVGDGSTLAIQYLTSFVNTGSIVVQGGGTLSLDTYASALSTTQSAGGSVEVDGLLNANGGTITVSADSAFATLTNDGTIADATLVLSGGTLSSGYGLYQGDTIVGTMEIGGSDTAVVQQGLTALAADGTSPGTVAVDGAYATLEFNDSETFDKATVVLGSAGGVDMLDAEGTLTLGTNAVVETAGTNFIDMITGNGTVINDGTILADAASGTFTIEPGSFVNDGTLAVSGGIEMDIEPSGTFANAGTVTVGDGSTLAIQYLAGISNTGTIAVNGGSLSVGQTLQGTGGNITLSNGASASLAGATSGQTLTFADGTDSLTLTAPADFAATIDGFQSGDSITLDGVTSATESYADGVLTVTEGGTTVATLAISGNYQTSDFVAIESGGNLVIETDVLPCFAAGTRILTAQGETAVEALEVGDQVVTVTDGVRQLAAVTWIGHREVDLTRHAEPERVRPVRIERGAFGDGMPARDLVLSPDHAIFADGVLVPVKYLVNGTTLRFDHAIKRITYFHVELTQHEVLLAEGLPAESYLETGGRRMFENGGLPVELHPDFAPMAWDVLGCAPLVVTGPQVDAILARLASRARRSRGRRAAAA